MKPFHAISNLTWDNQIAARVGQPAHEQYFDTEAEARDWLRAKRGGGAISFHDGKDFRSIRVEPGE
jgi:hypothetical protein